MNSKDEKKFQGKRIQKLIRDISEAYANNMFDDFYYCPEYKGKNFTWEKFPVMVARIASVSSFMYFIDWDTYSDDLKKEIEKAVYEVTLTLAREKVKEEKDNVESNPQV